MNGDKFPVFYFWKLDLRSKSGAKKIVDRFRKWWYNGLVQRDRKEGNKKWEFLKK